MRAAASWLDSRPITTVQRIAPGPVLAGWLAAGALGNTPVAASAQARKDRGTFKIGSPGRQAGDAMRSATLTPGSHAGVGGLPARRAAKPAAFRPAQASGSQAGCKVNGR
jgi:hypothetical protein